jgi:hypothetical protein
LPAVGDVVTVVFDFDGVCVAVPGRIIGQPVEDPYVLWGTETDSPVGIARYHVRARFEGIYWMRGSGREVNAALLAAYALAGGRGKDALSGET